MIRFVVFFGDGIFFSQDNDYQLVCRIWFGLGGWAYATCICFHKFCSRKVVESLGVSGECYVS